MPPRTSNTPGSYYSTRIQVSVLVPPATESLKLQCRAPQSANPNTRLSPKGTLDVDIKLDDDGQTTDRGERRQHDGDDDDHHDGVDGRTEKRLWAAAHVIKRWFEEHGSELNIDAVGTVTLQRDTDSVTAPLAMVCSNTLHSTSSQLKTGSLDSLALQLAVSPNTIDVQTDKVETAIEQAMNALVPRLQRAFPLCFNSLFIKRLYNDYTQAYKPLTKSLLNILGGTASTSHQAQSVQAKLERLASLHTSSQSQALEKATSPFSRSHHPPSSSDSSSLPAAATSSSALHSRPSSIGVSHIDSTEDCVVNEPISYAIQPVSQSRRDQIVQHSLSLALSTVARNLGAEKEGLRAQRARARQGIKNARAGEGKLTQESNNTRPSTAAKTSASHEQHAAKKAEDERRKQKVTRRIQAHDGTLSSQLSLLPSAPPSANQFSNDCGYDNNTALVVNADAAGSESDFEFEFDFDSHSTCDSLDGKMYHSDEAAQDDTHDLLDLDLDELELETPREDEVFESLF